MSDQSSPSPKRQSSSPVKKNSTISTTTFFFKSKPKRLLNNVKRMLAFEEKIEGVEKEVKRPKESEKVIESKEFEEEIEEPKEFGKVKKIQTVPDKIPTSSTTIQFIDLSDEISTQEILPMAKRKISTPTPEPDEIMIPDIDPLLRKALEQKSKSSILNTQNLSPVSLIVHEELSPHQKIYRFEYQILPNERISKVYNEHCKQRKINYYSCVLTYNGDRLFTSSTPASLGCLSGSIEIRKCHPSNITICIDVYNEVDYKKREESRKERLRNFFKSTNVQAKVEIEAEDVKRVIEWNDDKGITLKIKGKHSEPIEISVDPTKDILENFLSDVRERLELKRDTPLRLYFDGSALDLRKVISDLNLEDGDLLEFR